MLNPPRAYPFLLGALALTLLLGAPAQAQDAYDTTLMDALEAAGEYTTLVSALDAAGFDQPLSVDGPFTLFAPTDEAFDALPEGQLEAIMQDPAALEGLLGFHLVPGEYAANDLSTVETLETAFGQTVTVTVDGEVVGVNNATVLHSHIEADNGIIHAVDAVILDR